MRNHGNLGIFQGYGMTETNPLISKVSLKNKSRQLYLNQKLDSVGTVIKSVKIYINDNNKLIKKPLTEGEIVVKGKNTMIGYYKDPSETKKVKAKNMIYTCDIGFYDKDGYIYILGRKKKCDYCYRVKCLS